MFKRLQGIIVSVLIGALLTSGMVFAKQATDSISAVYRNIRLIVDGVQIEPKDAAGKVVEPFIYNGTTYLPVRAVGEAFGKEVSWDGNTSTVYVGGKTDKPAKDVEVWNKPYLEVGQLQGFKTYTANGKNYLDFELYYGSHWERVDNLIKISNYVVYALNSQCKKVSGTLLAIDSRSSQCVFTFSDENGKVIYTSPIITPSTEPVSFTFNAENVLKLKITAVGLFDDNYRNYGIENLTFTTTDY